MKYRAQSALRRLAAWIISLFVLVSQLALPAYALTQAEIDAMPTVTVYYQTAQDAASCPSSPRRPPTCRQGLLAVLPAEAFSFPVTLSVLAVPGTTNTFTRRTLGDHRGCGHRRLYRNFHGDYLLSGRRPRGGIPPVRSTAEMPAEVPPAEVAVTYVDADNPSNVLYSTTFTAYYNTTTA
jgi:hypothetical protein